MKRIRRKQQSNRRKEKKERRARRDGSKPKARRGREEVEDERRPVSKKGNGGNEEGVGDVGNERESKMKEEGKRIDRGQASEGTGDDDSIDPRARRKG